MLAQVASVDTCTLYEVAVFEVAHESIAANGWPAAPFDGEESWGAGGRLPVWKDHTLLKPLQVLPLYARTCQKYHVEYWRPVTLCEVPAMAVLS